MGIGLALHVASLRARHFGVRYRRHVPRLFHALEFSAQSRIPHRNSLGQTQFSALIPGMRTNSRMLLVTIINPSLRA